MEREQLDNFQVIRWVDGASECVHDFAKYPSVGGMIRIVKCRKCKLEAMITTEE